ncbi:sensor domain-containing diguanylate cyclase [Deinococcus roseus]|uniref:Diguanylate cyclase n=1 Tax=Deinococcus roseus TaxID=392414 RepID=A0ABQ2DD14_9DEIO|nr:GGDEF domain-containing protein [Deinococcus roseus]GGJ53591.1 hypothetical protein GCM10008938_44520 [Deinococcus roseus]
MFLPRVSTPFMRLTLLLLAGLALPLLWPDVFQNLLSTRGFEVDHHDDWPQSLVALHVGSDVLIGIAYAVIASILAILVHKNRCHLPFDWVLLSFGLFIVACGFTHLMHVLVRFTPMYYLDTYVRALTAVVSVATAVALPPLIPRVAQLLKANEQVQAHQQELEDKTRELEALAARAEFHASLSDLLQSVSDPLTVAERALEQMGPLLQAEQILAMRVVDDQAELWGVWGNLREDTRRRMEGRSSSPLSRLPLILQVVNSGEALYLNDYSQHPHARPIDGPPIAVALEPVKDTQGRVVASLNFTRPATLPWQDAEKKLMRRAAATVAVALSRTELQSALRESEQKYRSIAENYPNGTVQLFDADLRYQLIDGEAIRDLGLSAQELEGKTIFELWEPDFARELEAHYRRALSGKAAVLEVEFQGRWFLNRALPVRNAAGNIMLGLNTAQDITEERQQKQELKRLARVNQILLEVAHLSQEPGTAEEVARKVLLKFKDALSLDWLGMGVQDGDTARLHHIWHSQHATGVLQQTHLPDVQRGVGMTWLAIEAGHAVYIDDYPSSPRASETYLQVKLSSVALVPLTNPATGDTIVLIASKVGDNRGWQQWEKELFEAARVTVGVAMERQQHLLQMEEAALQDALTGLGNRRAFELDLKTEHARSRRHDHAFGLMMLDLDGLKGINDRMGHEAGDRLIACFAQELQSHMRTHDRCYRLGGDEFAVILSHSSLSSSEVLHGRICTLIQGVQQEGFPTADVSVGLAFFPEERSGLEDLLRLADERMYQMKERHHLET